MTLHDIIIISLFSLLTFTFIVETLTAGTKWDVTKKIQVPISKKEKAITIVMIIAIGILASVICMLALRMDIFIK